MPRDGWERLSKAGDKLTARWVHRPSGWLVVHCGHPTANWPYAAIDPAQPGRITASASGRGWRTLALAFAAIEGAVAGALAIFDDGPTKHGHRQVIAAERPAWLREGMGQS